jgi:hypothetical protein
MRCNFSSALIILRYYRIPAVLIRMMLYWKRDSGSAQWNSHMDLMCTSMSFPISGNLFDLDGLTEWRRHRILMSRAWLCLRFALTIQNASRYALWLLIKTNCDYWSKHNLLDKITISSTKSRLLAQTRNYLMKRCRRASGNVPIWSATESCIIYVRTRSAIVFAALHNLIACVPKTKISPTQSWVNRQNHVLIDTIIYIFDRKQFAISSTEPWLLAFGT